MSSAFFNPAKFCRISVQHTLNRNAKTGKLLYNARHIRERGRKSEREARRKQIERDEKVKALFNQMAIHIKTDGSGKA